jgi:hypothetical protein
MQSIGTTFFVHTPITELIVMQVTDSHAMFSDEFGRTITENGGGDISEEDFGDVFALGEMNLLIKQLEEIWGSRPNLRVTVRQAFADKLYQPPRKRWVLEFIRQ